MQLQGCLRLLWLDKDLPSLLLVKTVVLQTAGFTLGLNKQTEGNWQVLWPRISCYNLQNYAIC